MASKFELYHRTLVPHIEVITTVNTVIIIHVWDQQDPTQLSIMLQNKIC